MPTLTPGQSSDRGASFRRGSSVDPGDLAKWLEGKTLRIAARWAEVLKTSGSSWHDALMPVLRGFSRGLVSFLPGMLTPYRAQVFPLWSECAEIFGSVAARRGLSAGDVIEEFQALREVLIRVFYRSLADELGRGLSLREIVQLNRVLDAGVTRASIGHTDLLFFSLIRGSGAPPPLDADDVKEVCSQIRLLEGEGRRIMAHLARANGT